MKPEESKQLTPETPQVTDQEILTADITTLTVGQMQRRIAINAVRKSEMELEVVENQAQKFREEKSERVRYSAMKTEIIAQEQEKIRGEQSICKHMTGGKGLAGLLARDGKMGASIATQELPDGRIYFLCFRCQKESHLPKKRDVLNGTLTLKQYRAAEKDYHRIASLDKSLFQTDTGGIPGSCKFRIPKLEMQRAVDDQEFEIYLEKNPGEVALAG